MSEAFGKIYGTILGLYKATVDVLTGKKPDGSKKIPDTRQDANPQALGITDVTNEKVLAALGNPQAAIESLAEAAGVIIGAAAALSLIPFESNFGSELAGRALYETARPLFERGISGPLDEGIKRFLRFGSLNPRILISMIEAGAISEDALIEEMFHSETHNPGVAALVAYARIKSFQANVKDDVALLEELRKTRIAEAISSAKLVVQLHITDLTSQRNTLRSEQKSLMAQRKGKTGSDLQDLETAITSVGKQIGVVNQEISDARALLVEVPAMVLTPLAKDALDRVTSQASVLGVPPPPIANALTEQLGVTPQPGDLVTVRGGRRIGGAVPT